MAREMRKHFDVLTIGGGPAGLAASVRAAECGLRVGIVDDNLTLGGQIWRGDVEDCTSEAAAWVERLSALEIEMLCGTRVFDVAKNLVWAEGTDATYELGFTKLVLATGARERFLPFPGWTLPNVMGAGGLQALVKSGLPIAGKRVVVAGSGPLLLAVAAYLRKHGAGIPIICEQASWSRLAQFGFALLQQPQKIAQGLSLKGELAGVPLAANSWPIAAEGRDALEQVVISRNGRLEMVACDYLACGFHLVPNVELAALIGCRLRNGHVQTDEFQQTSVPDVYCAGEPTGIGGLELSRVEGEIAGFTAGGNRDAAGKLFATRRRLQKFAGALDRTFRIRPELRSLPLAQTIVCRCEDVTYARLRQQRSWRAAKLQTRCGMGPCQGRVCSPATQFLFGWISDSVRPPVFPTRFSTLAAMSPDAEHSQVTGGN
jgi:NADPH-dependent 2,4-dienoyl-CoA reductase/sulfur reductase-like enzyme